METELKSLVKVSAAVVASLAYARFAAATLPPGSRRFVAFLPVIILFPCLPWYFTTVHLRGISSCCLVWLGIFKLLLLSSDLGPLHPSLPLLTFIVTAAFPVKLRSSPPSQTTQLTKPSKLFLTAAVCGVIFAAITPVYAHRHRIPRHLLLSIYCIHVYLLQNFVLSAAAFVAAANGLEVEPMFNAPYLSSSLADFWGRRWNLLVPSVLRPAVYIPVRTRFGAAAGVISTFLVSGLMHEVMFYYYIPKRPTWEATAFFVLHGVCVVVEGKVRRAGWAPAMAPAVKTAATLGFVAVTAFSLYFPPILKSGAEAAIVEEAMAAMGAAGRVFTGAGRVFTGVFQLAACQISTAV